MMKNICVIPARAGSKRLPNKNIKMLGGLPLLAHSIIYAKKNQDIINAIYVSTDDETIKKIALQYGATVIDRPKELSGDFEPTVTAVNHVLKTIQDDVENVILLQPTNPYRPNNLLKDSFNKFSSGNHDSLMTVTRNYHKLGKIIDDKFVPFNYKMGQRSQDLDPLYYENGLLYITKAKLIMENKILGVNNFPFKVEHPFAFIDIDSENDFKYAQFILNHYPNA